MSSPQTETYTDRVFAYADQVVNDEIPACKWVKLACQNSIDHYNAAQNPQHPHRFSEARAERFCRFVELFRHLQGDKGGTLLVLDPWQRWFFGNLFGWVIRAMGKRLYRTAHMEVPRGNGKTFANTATALYMLAADGEKGPECYTAATKRDQANILFDAVKQHTTSTHNAELMQKLGIQTFAHAITVPRNYGSFKSLSRDGKKVDGYNVHLAIVDEIHAHPTRFMWDTLKSGAQKRSQSLVLAITTAGYDLSNLGYEQNQYCQKVLLGGGNGGITDDSFWGCVWTTDEEDDPWAEATWIKANPGWQSMIDKASFRGEATAAQAFPTKQPEFMTKHLNVWGKSTQAWASMSHWKACQDASLSLSDFQDAPCWIGVDLSSTQDITAKAYVFPEMRDKQLHVTAFLDYYLPADTIRQSGNASYKGWVLGKYITEHQGASIDQNAIIEDIIQDCEDLTVRQIGYDPFNAQWATTQLVNEGLSAEKVRQGYLTMNSPMKMLDELTRTSRFHCPIDPVLMWMADNTEVDPDASGNIKPDKAASRGKIDGISALVTAMALALNSPEAKPSVYEKRNGFVVFG